MQDKMSNKSYTKLYEFELKKESSITAIKYSTKNQVLIPIKKQNIRNIYIAKKYFSFIKIFFFELILILLPKQILLEKHFIKLKLKENGYQRIFNEKYIGSYPNITYINSEVTIFRNEKLDVKLPNSTIEMIWDRTLSDFTYMFSGANNIISVSMNNLLDNNCNMSYMFSNCYGLEKFEYTSAYNSNHLITDTIGMFYNCISLLTFSFNGLYMNQCNSLNLCSNNYFYRYMSYMFYNCQSLKNIVNSKDIRYVKDMKGMFYNCISLESLDLTKFQTDSCSDCYIDISYMLYNCKSLATFSLTKDFYVKDMNNMFYNCESLERIDINYFKSSSLYHVNMTNLFYNCIRLDKIIGNFNNFFISDMRNMFFNCEAFRYTDNENKDENIILYINDQNTDFDINYKINMSKMFYNCQNIRKVNILTGNTNYYIFPNDLNSIFYNCISLKSVNLEYFRLDNARNMSYMFYNCKSLLYFTRSQYTYDSTSLIKKRTMKAMFENCESLISLDLTNNFDTKNVEIMWDMFKGCKKLTNLNLQNPDTFDTSQVTDMQSMFEECTSLALLNINTFNTEKVQYMKKMFYNCKSLKSLYFRSISSNSLGTMYQMFYHCESLKYLDLYSLTEKSQSFINIFEGVTHGFQFCIKENEDMPNIFKALFDITPTTRDCTTNCYDVKRSSVPEKKLCCKYVKYKNNCYEKCPGRTRVQNRYKECENFTCPYDRSLANYENYIYYSYDQNDCIDHIPDKFFLNETTLKTIDKCHDDCATCLQKETDENHTNCETCESIKPFIYLGNCYEKCKYGNYTENGIIKCYCFNEKCLICPEPAARMNLCTECNNAKGYYKKEYEIDTFDCYRENLIQHYYKDNLLYKCYDSCKTCSGPGEKEFHNCQTCDDNTPFIYNKSNTINCYQNCSFYYYYFDKDNDGEYKCTETNKCPQKYPYLIPDIGQCVMKCEDNVFYRYFFFNKCFSSCPPDTINDDETDEYLCNLRCPFERPFKINSTMTCVSNCTIEDRRDRECVTHYFGTRPNLEIQDKIVEDIENHLTSRTFNYKMLDNETIIIEENQTNYELTVMGRNFTSSKTSSLNIENCEEALREYYQIPKPKNIYLLKFDIDLQGLQGPTVEYKAYYPLESTIRLDPLDLTICEGKPAYVSYKLNLSEDVYFYDKNSPYYNDLCASYDSNDGFDMNMDDRKSEYINGNKSLCEENCIFERYEEETAMVHCSCLIKFNFPLVTEITIDKEKLYKFMDIKMIANFNVLNCWNLLITKEGIMTNLGFYIFIPAFITYFVCLVLFYLKDYNKIKKQLDDIVSAKKLIKSILDKLKKMKKPHKKSDYYKYPEPIGLLIIKGKKKFFNELQNYIKENKININVTNSIKNKQNKRDKLISQGNNIINPSTSKDNMISNNEKTEKIEKEKYINDKISSLPIKNSSKLMNTKKFFGNKDFSSKKRNLELNDNNISLNNLSYSLDLKISQHLNKEQKEKIDSVMNLNDTELNALGYIKALKCDKRSYIEYYISLLKTKHLVIKIFNKRDYNSQMIKIFLSVFNLCMNFAVNALFFNDDTMHKILEDGGEFNFIYQLPQIIYSTVLCVIFENFLNFLALSEDSILNIKHEKKLGNITRLARNLWRALQIKFINFFIFSFIFLVVFWYYVTCFCAVYKKTQFHLIKDNLISFGTGMLTPLGICLLPGLFRIPAIKNRKELMFLLSKILQLF